MSACSSICTRVVSAPILKPPFPSGSMRSSPWMVLRLTTRGGRTMYALREVSRSCPPPMGRGISSGSALGSAGLSSFTASSTLEALAHSNAFIGSSYLLHLHQAVEDFVGGNRQLAHAHAARVVDGIGHSADAGNIRRLRHPDDDRSGVAVVDDWNQLRYFESAGN